MWGELWGAMVWGGATPVPGLGVFGLLALAGFLARTALRRAVPPLMLMAATALLILPAVAAIAVPNSFTNGTVADAEEINENFASVEAMHDRFVLVTGLPSHSTSSTSFETVSGRTLTFDKQPAGSVLRVTYEDFFGYTTVGAGTCTWRLLFDGVASGQKVIGHTSTNRSISGSYRWLLDSVAAGTQALEVQVRATGATTQCDSGTVQTANFVLVEELGS